MQVETSGKVRVATGVGTQGQGHFTVFAQIVAEQLGVDVADVEVVTGDTDEFHWGTGTFASRGAVVAGNAVHAAAEAVRAEGAAARRASTSASPRTTRARRRRGAGDAATPAAPSRSASWRGSANPLRGAVKPGTEPGLEATATSARSAAPPPAASTP